MSFSKNKFNNNSLDKILNDNISNVSDENKSFFIAIKRIMESKDKVSYKDILELFFKDEMDSEQESTVESVEFHYPPLVDYNKFSSKASSNDNDYIIDNDEVFQQKYNKNSREPNN